MLTEKILAVEHFLQFRLEHRPHFLRCFISDVL